MAKLLAPSPLLRTALSRPSPSSSIRSSLLAKPTPTTRFISNLPTLRPSLLPRHNIFRAPTPATTTTRTAEGVAVDVVAKSQITAHPALAGVGAQMRCGPRPTMSGATRLIQKRRHGFLSRIRTRNGRNLLKRRQAKGRKRLSA